MTSAIIVAAGKGTRMGPNIDKLFLEVAGKPVIGHTWQAFDSASCIDEIVLVIREGWEKSCRDLAVQFQFKKRFHFAIGGAQRQDSVWNGLQKLNPSTEIVVIQDGARPCTRESLITATVVAARESGAAVAAQPASDTIKESADGRVISRHLDRQSLWTVQTPQTFRVAVIRGALAAVREKNISVTDDTAACEWVGQPVRLVSSNAPNPKVTLPTDLPYIEMLLQQ